MSKQSTSSAFDNSPGNQIISHFKHKLSDDKRTQNEKMLTEKITECLTEINLRRINQHKQKFQSSQFLSSIKTKCQDDVVFVCLNGVPPFPDEFEKLNLPGQKIVICLAGYQIGISEQQRQKRSFKSQLNNMAHEIHQRINLQANGKKVVFVYHSFGTFMVSFYFKLFYKAQKQKIAGLIEIGAVPITMYPVLQFVLKQFSLLTSKQFLLENLQFLYEKSNEEILKLRKKGLNLSLYKSRHQITSLYLSYRTQGFSQIFQMNRNFPKILKLIIYGARDTMYPKQFLDEKTVYYCYNKSASLQQQYENTLKSRFQKLYQQQKKPTNIQEKFVYKFPKGQHSLHIQKKLNQQLNLAINEYLDFIL